MQSKILHYMRQMAVITPYAEFLFKYVPDPDVSEYVISLSCTCAHTKIRSVCSISYFHFCAVNKTSPLDFHGEQMQCLQFLLRPSTIHLQLIYF